MNESWDGARETWMNHVLKKSLNPPTNFLKCVDWIPDERDMQVNLKFGRIFENLWKREGVCVEERDGLMGSKKGKRKRRKMVWYVGLIYKLNLKDKLLNAYQNILFAPKIAWQQMKRSHESKIYFEINFKNTKIIYELKKKKKLSEIQQFFRIFFSL